MQQVYYLFVYGSLRSGFKSPAYDYISKYFSFVAEGKAKGLLYDMGKYPVAKSCVSNHFIIDLKLSQFFPNWLNFFKEEDFPSSKLHFHYHY